MPERNGFLHGRFIEEEAVMTDMEEISQIKPSLTSRSAAPERKIPPLPKTRSLSDSGGTPVKLSPSPLILEANRKTSKDDSSIPSAPPSQTPGTPVTPRRPNVASYGAGLSIQMPPRDFTPPAPFGNSNPLLNPAPLSPKLEHSQIYASPTNLLPRRSRGLDFTRAATSLHHSTLAEQSSPESSPTIGGRRAMSISSRRGDFGGPEQTSTSLWSMMGSQEKMNASASLGSSNHAIVSDSSSSSDDDNLMDEDMDDAFVTTPQVNRMSSGLSGPNGTLSSPAMGSLMSFQNRQRYRKQNKKKLRGPMGQNRSPPNGIRSRRDSISWQANQLHISSRERDNEDGHKSDVDSPDGRGVIRRAVTRRGNMLPKPKTFARIRAALMEEGAPAEVETMREAEVIRQVRESDVEPDRRPPLPISETLAGDANTNGLPSPNLNDDLNDIPEDDMMADLANGLSGSFKPQPLLKSARGRAPWDNYSETGSIGGAESTPPPGAFLPRGSSSGISDDNGVESPAGMTAISVSSMVSSYFKARSANKLI